MITKPALAEAVSALRIVLQALKGCSTDTGAAGATLLYLSSLLSADAPRKIAGADMADLQACFDAAVAAGATSTTMTSVYTAASALSPSGAPARIVVAYCKSLAVIRMGRIVTAQAFTSRDDIDAALTTIKAAFADVEAAAGNAFQAQLYQALVTLRAAVTATLNDASYPLPELSTYRVGSTVSALVLGQRLYGDAGRALELVENNRVFNPVFMPLAGQALSA